MADITLRGTPVTTIGSLPAVGSPAPAFTLTAGDLSDLESASLAGSTVILNIFPSIDTGVCAASVRKFNELAADLENTKVVCVSADLPMAQARFCGAEGIESVLTGSSFRSEFGTDYGVTMVDGALRGLLSRSVVVIDPNGTVSYTEQVPEIGREPDYDAALAAARG